MTTADDAKAEGDAAPATETTEEADSWFYFDTKFDLSHTDNRLYSPKCVLALAARGPSPAPDRLRPIAARACARAGASTLPERIHGA